MSRGFSVAWLFMGLCGFAVLSSWLGPSAWLVTAVLMWLSPVAYATDLKRPRGLGAWMLWSAWSCVAALFCREPLISVAALWPGATGVLIFALAYSWWGRPHRRAWLGSLWFLGALLAAISWRTGRCDAVSGGFIIAALGSCLGLATKDLSESNRMRAVAWWLSALYLAIAAALAWKHRAGITEALVLRRHLWEAGAAIAFSRPSSGVGPGLFERGFLLSDHFSPLPGPLASWSRFEDQAFPGSEWSRVAAETGLIGLALLLVAVIFSGPRLLDDRRFPARGSSREWERRAAAGGFWALTAFSLVETIFDRQALLVLWFTALACSAPGSNEEESRSFRIDRRWALAGAILCLLCAWPKAFSSAAARSGRLSRMYTAAWLAPGDAALSAEIARRCLLLNPPQIGAAAAWLDQAIQSSPRQALYLYRKAELFKAQGAWPEAMRWTAQALALEPEFVSARLILAQGRRRAGDLPGAREQIAALRQTLSAQRRPRDEYERQLLEFDPAQLEEASQLAP